MSDTRLNKALSILGICSRRDADKLIIKGEIFVNGEQIFELGKKIQKNDKISINEKSFIFCDKKETKIWLYYKPRGLVTTHKDEKNRITIFDDIKKKIKQRVISVGRLDLNSEGLILLTNDGEFARYAESPQTGWERHYKVRVFGNIENETLNKLESKNIIDEIEYAPLQIKSIKKNDGKNFWIECVLTEGKNREIRKIFKHFNLEVNKLIRTQYGPFKIDNLKIGEIREILSPESNFNNFTKIQNDHFSKN